MPVLQTKFKKWRVLETKVVTYTILVANTGLISVTTAITDPLPAHTTYLTGSSTVNGIPLELYDARTNSV